MQTPTYLLFIDDDINWVQNVRKFLIQKEFQIEIAHDCEQGLFHLQKYKGIPIALIFVDLKKVKDQPDAFEKICQIGADREFRSVVLFPTEITPETVAEMFRFGADDCVGKPYENTKFLTLIEQQLNKQPKEQNEGVVKKINQPPHILIVEDDEDWRVRLTSYLGKQDYDIQSIGEYADAVKLLTEKQFDTLILDLRLIDTGQNFEGMTLLDMIRNKQHNDVPVIIISAYATVEHVMAGFKQYNIFGFQSKQQFDRVKYLQMVQNAVVSITNKA